MADVKGVDQLKEHLERAKEHLSSTNETIKKYTGREPGAPRPNFRQIDSEAAGRRIFSNALKRGISSSIDDGPISKSYRRGLSTPDDTGRVPVAYSRFETRRRERDVYGRLGPLPRSTISNRVDDDDRDRNWSRRDFGRDRDWIRESKEEEIKERVRRLDEDDFEDEKPPRRRPITISSSINRKVDDDKFDNDDTKPMPRKMQTTASVVRVPEQRSREDAINEMNSLAKKDKERNRRIISGLLLNTLRNFNSQATRSDDVAKRRRNVEARIEEREAEEKEDLRRERADLYKARRDNQRMVRRIEQKIRSVDAFEAWKKEFEKQKFFIRTRSKPHIYYLPKLMDATSERRKARTSKEVDSEIAARRAKMEEEVAQLIEEEPQDPNQLLEETNRSRQLQGRESEAEAKANGKAADSSAHQPDFDELGPGGLQEPTVNDEEQPRVEVSVYVGDEEEPPTPEKAQATGAKAESSAEAGAARKEGLDEDAAQLPVVVEVNIADEDIPLPPSPPPPRTKTETSSVDAAAAGGPPAKGEGPQEEHAGEEATTRRTDAPREDDTRRE